MINKDTQKSVSTILDLEVYNKLKSLADADKRSMSAYISILVEKHLKSI